MSTDCQGRNAFRRPRLIALRSLLLLLGGRLGTDVAIAENIARGKPYEWSTPPRYGECADQGDATQLTDGTSKGASWQEKSTVGWVHQGRVTVTIDLGVVQSIGRVAFVAAGGGSADVFFPAVTVIVVSEDGKTWRVGGAVGSGGLVQDRSKWYSHRFETGEIETRGRYVRLVFQAEERYLFLDEIEVHSAARTASPRTEAVSDKELNALLKQGLRARWVAGEWPEFRKQIAAFAARGATGAQEIAGRLEEIDNRVLAVDVTNSDAAEALRAGYTQLRAEVARSLYGDALLVQRVDPWAEYRGETFPPAQPARPAKVDLIAWQDEYETAAWTATNLGSAAARVRIRIGPLHDGKGRAYPWTCRLSLRKGMAIPTRVGYRVVDALPLLDADDRNGAETEVGAGEYRLLWLTVCARNLPAGAYQAEIRVEASPSGELLLASPLTLTVSTLRMPAADERALAAYVWEEHLAGWQQPTEVVDDLRAHGVNTFMMHPSELPRPKFDRSRARLTSVDFGRMDVALARRKGPRMHGIFWGGNPSFWGLDLGKAGDADLFKQFIRAWGNHLSQAGIQPGDFFFYPLDEETSERMIRIAKLIKEADPRFQVYWNRVNNPDVRPELMRRLTPYVDIACMNIFTLAAYNDTSRQESVFQELRKKHRPKVWTYACSGPGRLKAPDRYYRNLSWATFRMGGTGTGFWRYGYGKTWDAYEGKIHYGVVYRAEDAPPGVTRAEAMIPSRRWEAFREGTEDFEHLHEMQRTIAAARAAGGQAPACDRAAALLTEAVDRVLRAPDDPDRYDRARRSLAGAILQLRR